MACLGQKEWSGLKVPSSPQFGSVNWHYEARLADYILTVYTCKYPSSDHCPYISVVRGCLYDFFCLVFNILHIAGQPFVYFCPFWGLVHK
ncbi:hypothetical protein GDO78_004438 [Eleutherodactylus coqui]|uniref:Uncharacterized protein n=1 Tax=Eleutherodactylus coqui TaxID=57060 RepID=A0A8J6ERR2_ELECQ|nr:hypothetical protein GDO78_004438 [Eleutherodactylus coqui]